MRIPLDAPGIEASLRFSRLLVEKVNSVFCLRVGSTPLSMRSSPRAWIRWLRPAPVHTEQFSLLLICNLRCAWCKVSKVSSRYLYNMEYHSHEYAIASLPAVTRPPQPSAHYKYKCLYIACLTPGGTVLFCICRMASWAWPLRTRTNPCQPAALRTWIHCATYS